MANTEHLELRPQELPPAEAGEMTLEAAAAVFRAEVEQQAAGLAEETRGLTMRVEAVGATPEEKAAMEHSAAEAAEARSAFDAEVAAIMHDRQAEMEQAQESWRAEQLEDARTAQAFVPEAVPSLTPNFAAAMEAAAPRQATETVPVPRAAAETMPVPPLETPVPARGKKGDTVPVPSEKAARAKKTKTPTVPVPGQPAEAPKTIEAPASDLAAEWQRLAAAETALQQRYAELQEVQKKELDYGSYDETDNDRALNQTIKEINAVRAQQKSLKERAALSPAAPKPEPAAAPRQPEPPPAFAVAPTEIPPTLGSVDRLAVALAPTEASALSGRAAGVPETQPMSASEMDVLATADEYLPPASKSALKSPRVPDFGEVPTPENDLPDVPADDADEIPDIEPETDDTISLDPLDTVAAVLTTPESGVSASARADKLRESIRTREEMLQNLGDDPVIRERVGELKAELAALETAGSDRPSNRETLLSPGQPETGKQPGTEPPALSPEPEAAPAAPEEQKDSSMEIPPSLLAEADAWTRREEAQWRPLEELERSTDPKDASELTERLKPENLGREISYLKAGMDLNERLGGFLEADERSHLEAEKKAALARLAELERHLDLATTRAETTPGAASAAESSSAPDDEVLEVNEEELIEEEPVTPPAGTSAETAEHEPEVPTEIEEAMDAWSEEEGVSTWKSLIDLEKDGTVPPERLTKESLEKEADYLRRGLEVHEKFKEHVPANNRAYLEENSIPDLQARLDDIEKRLKEQE